MNQGLFEQVFDDLAPQRRKVLLRLLAGETDKEIAASLYITETTVRKHIEEICKDFKCERDEQRSRRPNLIALFRKYKPELVNNFTPHVTSEGEAVETSKEEGSSIIANYQDFLPIPDPNFVGRENAIASSSRSEPHNLRGNDTQSFALPKNLPSVKNWVPGSRSDEIDKLKAQIFNPDTRAITITAFCVVGLAGIGKTTLSSQLVHQLHAEKVLFDAVAWESLRAVTGKSNRFASIMDSLLLTLSKGEITAAVTILDDDFKKIERLVKLLKDKPCLVVLDNVETVLKTKQAKRAGFVADDFAEYALLFQQLAESEHQSKVIFTSRETLVQLPRRETYTLQLGGLDQEAAVKLLQSFDLIATPEELAKLAKRYEQHPKALEIVAGVIKHENEFQGRVSKFLEDVNWLLVNTLDELIEQVTNRLSDEELKCLSQISVYETSEYVLSFGGIAAQIPEMSKRDVKENIIEALKRRQLLDYNQDCESYQMHPLVQEKASYLLNSESDRRIAHRQAHRYFLDLVKPEVEWKEFDDLKPLLRAHHHACQAQDWDEAATAIREAYKYLRQWCYFDIIIDLYTALIPKNWKDGGQLVTSSHIHSDILLVLGNAHHAVSQFSKSDEYYQHCLSISQRIGYRKQEAWSFCYMGLNQFTNRELALEYLNKSLAIAIEIREQSIQCKSLEYLGIFWFSQGDYHQSIKCHKQALDVAQQNEFEEEKGIAFGNLGHAYKAIGEYDLAMQYQLQYLEIAKKSKSPKREAFALVGLANLFNRKANYKLAIEYAVNCKVIAQRISDKHCESESMLMLGIAYRGLREYQSSIEILNQCLEVSREVAYPAREAEALCELGITYREVEKLEKSFENLKKSLIIFQKISENAEEARVLLELAKTCIKVQNEFQDNLQSYINKAEQISIALNLPLLIDVQKIKSDLQEKQS